MEQPARQVPFRKAAPVLHGALVVSSIATVGVVFFLRGGVPLALLPQARALLTYVGFGAAVVIAAVAVAIRGRIPQLERGTDADAWWRANRGRLVAVWALCEVAVILGAVLWLLTDAQAVFVALTGTGLFLLAAYRPSKLLETW